MVAEHSEEESGESIYQLEEVGAVSHQQTKLFSTTLYITEEAGETSILCQLDTGATCNVMTLTDLCVIKEHGNPRIKPTTAKSRVYDGTIIPVVGEATLKCKANKQEQDITFKIISGQQKPLLSGDTCIRLGLLTINSVQTIVVRTTDSLLEEYQDVFQGLGCLQGEYHIDLDTSSACTTPNSSGIKGET